ncbi:MAG: hypothetical protein M1823_001591 [Watsoniomyces obsoletus]|nr:MAG: hypothetical protein M1823_001591 [Watsoniomyces obsoletus]
MITTIHRRPWTCINCLSRQRRSQTSLATGATTSHIAQDRLHLFTNHVAPRANHDDRTLRQVFDSQPFWEDFSKKQKKLFRRSHGLFRNRHLTSRVGFQAFANISLERCKKLVTKILGLSSIDGFREIVRDLDTLSDLLCRVIDLSDFVRATHPDVGFQEAATAAYAQMFEYMNVLNTTRGLYDQLQKAMDTPEVVESWSEEERMTAQILMKDFSKSAIDLPDAQKQTFVQLSNEIVELGSAFVDNIRPDSSYVALDAGSFGGIDPAIARNHLMRTGKLMLPVGGMEAIMALRTVNDEQTRRKIYVAGKTSAASQIHRLKKLLQRRAKIGRLAGFSSYAHLTLADKMAKSPGSVKKFIQGLYQSNHGCVRTEFDLLYQLKQADMSKSGQSSSFHAWDREYYSNKVVSQIRQKTRHADSLNQYFSLGTVMQGLSRLFSRLYGVRLVPGEAILGETWNDDVRRVDVMDEQDGHIAVLYCDLFERPGKNPNPAHFTVRCSRRISEDEIAEAASESGSTKAEDWATDGMASSRNSEGDLYQLPTIALICDFARPHPSRPALLSFREMQTLFHEMGHALHSVLGRTAMQNVSGTRCATDFAELPSVLMEHFAADPRVLGLFARHWQTDEPLPYRMVQDEIKLHRRFEGAEVETQLLLAMLDQQYHSSIALDPDFDTTAEYHSVMDQYATIPEPKETSWQGQFGHLFGYGATYYSYLFDRAIAGKIWQDVFQRTHDGALSGEAGHLFREEVLRWGGSRDGWHCIAGVLHDDSLAAGDEAAMAKVGEWGVHD